MLLLPFTITDFAHLLIFLIVWSIRVYEYVQYFTVWFAFVAVESSAKWAHAAAKLLRPYAAVSMINYVQNVFLEPFSIN